MLSEITCQIPEAFHFDDFKFRDGKLYYKGKSTPLPDKQNKLRSVGVIAETLGEERLNHLGFNIPGGKVMA